jgi:hypothetical protein
MGAQPAGAERSAISPHMPPEIAFSPYVDTVWLRSSLPWRPSILA